MSLPFWEEKCWGRVMHCFANEQASVSYLEVVEGNQCSKHYHQERANTFIVVSGIIAVETWDGFPDVKPNVKLLGESDTFTVPSGVVHQFKVFKSGTLIEVYHPDRGGKVKLDDIVRLTVGGPIRD